MTIAQALVVGIAIGMTLMVLIEHVVIPLAIRLTSVRIKIRT